MLQANNIPYNINMLLSYNIQCTSLFVCQTSRHKLVELMLIKTKPSWVDACSVVDLSNLFDQHAKWPIAFFVDISLKAQMTLYDTLRV